jgi:putative transcriptional regulator
MWTFNKERLVALRESKGMTQDEFAVSLNTIKQHISLWETGKSVPSIVSLIKICNKYDVDVRYFFAKSGNTGTASSNTQRETRNP